jgi:peptidoglycan/LPS O-acetylase OafA/YrhL
MKRITQLDGLRGIAAMMVLALHYNTIKTSFLTNNFFVEKSWLFVDFFFVLSGFIIASNYYSKITNFNSFISYFKKRIVRIFPLLLFTVIVYLIYEIIGLRFNLKTDPEPVSYYLLQTLDSLTFLNSTVLLGETQGMNPPSWSISAEMISYLVFGLSLLFFKKNKIIIITGVIIILCMSFMIKQNNFAFKNGDFGFVRGLLGFNLGVLTFNISQMKNVKTNRFEIPMIILITGMFWITSKYTGTLASIQYMLLPFIFSATVYVFRFSSGFFSTFLDSRPFQFLGKLSYSIYLNHYLILIVVFQFFF